MSNVEEFEEIKVLRDDIKHGTVKKRVTVSECTGGCN